MAVRPRLPLHQHQDGQRQRRQETCAGTCAGAGATGGAHDQEKGERWKSAEGQEKCRHGGFG